MTYTPDRHDVLISETGRVKIFACSMFGYITIDDGVYSHPEIDNCSTLNRDEAIAAAKAILAHFEEV